MALSLVLATAPNATVRHLPSGRAYQATSTGQVTIIATDAAQLFTNNLMFNAQAFSVTPTATVAQPPLIPLFWTGATADRPTPASAVGTAPTDPETATNPPPALGTPMYDTTTASVIFFVDQAVASTRWVDRTGAAV